MSLNSKIKRSKKWLYWSRSLKKAKDKNFSSLEIYSKNSTKKGQLTPTRITTKFKIIVSRSIKSQLNLTRRSKRSRSMSLRSPWREPLNPFFNNNQFQAENLTWTQTKNEMIVSTNLTRRFKRLASRSISLRSLKREPLNLSILINKNKYQLKNMA